MRTCRSTPTAPPSLSEIPLAGRACCLNIGGLHQALQQLYIEVIIVSFQAPSYIFSLHFCINRTSGFLFLKCFAAGRPILTAVLEKVTHTFYSSPFCLSLCKKKKKKTEEREREREAVPSDWEWLKAACCHTLLVLMTRQNYTVLKMVRRERRKRDRENKRKGRKELKSKPRFDKWMLSRAWNPSCLAALHNVTCLIIRRVTSLFPKETGAPLLDPWCLICKAPRITLKWHSVWRPSLLQLIYGC